MLHPLTLGKDVLTTARKTVVVERAIPQVILNNNELQPSGGFRGGKGGASAPPFGG